MGTKKDISAISNYPRNPVDTKSGIREASGRQERLLQAGLTVLAGLFLWKGTSGWWFYPEVELSFRRQRVFGDWAPHLAKANIGLLVLSGVLLTLGVPFRKFRLYGLALSVAILAGYTIYTQVVLLDTFGSICACIGWFAGMSWTGIFIMNAILLVLVLTLFFITLKERRPP